MIEISFFFSSDIKSSISYFNKIYFICYRCTNTSNFSSIFRKLRTNVVALYFGGDVFSGPWHRE